MKAREKLTSFDSATDDRRLKRVSLLDVNAEQVDMNAVQVLFHQYIFDSIKRISCFGYHLSLKYHQFQHCAGIPP